VPPGVAQACVVEYCREKTTPENSLVVNGLPELVWTARPEGRVNFLSSASANTPDFALPKPAAVTQDDKSTTVTRSLVSVVDDDESVRESLPDLLKEFGFAARAFLSPEEFLASGCVPETKCLILDIAMPGMSGPDLQRELKSRGHEIPIIFITASTDKAVRPRLLERGAVECLFKPFSDTALLEALNLALPPK
jgi:CheY-like chemotaxis protein